MTPPIPARVAERAATRYTEDPNGCWLSTYSIASHGYAQIGWQQDARHHMTTAHRAAWTHHHGPIPAGLTVDHECRVRPCVRPDHLRLLPNGANAADNGQIRVNPGVGRLCACGDELVQRPGATYAPYCRTCQNRRRRARRSAGRVG